ncbi:hypothetical protein [Streptomyces sp. F001]|uniref:hypothetical protein n=1 Tax=Streptomyces sp. F001 TaxID=1510026 RepID=UPI00101E289D|nr:hypothetical protein [Streptomyces sp. F001]RZB16858.1 hypothetical protein StrepF001_23245 [Streptomyces sp. F001]
MRVRNALVFLGLGAALAVGAPAVTAQAAPSGCSSWQTSPTFAYGVCNRVPQGDAWRLGIRCSDGDYDWSAWKYTTQRTSLRCNNSGAVITHHWIDPAN